MLGVNVLETIIIVSVLPRSVGDQLLDKVVSSVAVSVKVVESRSVGVISVADADGEGVLDCVNVTVRLSNDTLASLERDALDEMDITMVDVRDARSFVEEVECDTAASKGCDCDMVRVIFSVDVHDTLSETDLVSRDVSVDDINRFVGVGEGSAVRVFDRDSVEERVALDVGETRCSDCVNEKRSDLEPLLSAELVRLSELSCVTSCVRLF